FAWKPRSFTSMSIMSCRPCFQRVQRERELQRVVYDLSNTPYVDVAGARMLRRLHDELADKKIAFTVVGAHSEVRDRLRFEKLQDWVGPINRHISLGEAVMTNSSSERSKRTDAW